MTTWADSDIYPLFLLALCTWRESRGDSAPNAQLGVAYSIRNRTLSPRWWGHDWISVILCREQYSSFNPGDPNATKFPSGSDSSWAMCYQAAVSAYVGAGTDPTLGAQSYYSVDIPEPSWASEMSFTVQLGSIRFYKT